MKVAGSQESKYKQGTPQRPWSQWNSFPGCLIWVLWAPADKIEEQVIRRPSANCLCYNAASVLTIGPSHHGPHGGWLDTGNQACQNRSSSSCRNHKPQSPPYKNNFWTLETCKKNKKKTQNNLMSLIQEQGNIISCSSRNPLQELTPCNIQQCQAKNYPLLSDPPCSSPTTDSLSNRLVAKSLFIVVMDTPRCCSRANA